MGVPPCKLPLLIAVVLPLSTALATPATATRKLIEIAPAKGLMLMKTWQARFQDMNVLKTVPDGKTGKKLKVVSAMAGEEAARRALCKSEFHKFQARALSLANADAGDYPQAQRQVLPELKPKPERLLVKSIRCRIGWLQVKGNTGLGPHHHPLCCFFLSPPLGPSSSTHHLSRLPGRRSSLDCPH